MIVFGFSQAEQLVRTPQGVHIMSLKNKFMGMFSKKKPTLQEGFPQVQSVAGGDTVSEAAVEHRLASVEESGKKSSPAFASKLAEIESIIESSRAASRAASRAQLDEPAVVEPEPAAAAPLEESDVVEIAAAAQTEAAAAEAWPAGLPPPADSLVVNAETILKYFPEEYLTAPLEQLIAEHKDTGGFTVVFNRTELMYGLSQGVLEFKVTDLVSKLSINVFRVSITNLSDHVLDLPLSDIVPLIPPEWFATGEQDDSKERAVIEMEDVFPLDQRSPSTVAAEPAEAPEEVIEPEAATPTAAAAPPQPPSIQPPPPAIRAPVPSTGEAPEPAPIAAADPEPETVADPEPVPVAAAPAKDISSLADQFFKASDAADTVAEPEAEAAPPQWRSQAPNGIDINRGGPEELAMLGGVTDELAKTIIDYRNANGPFGSVQDLGQIPEVDDTTYRSATGLSKNVTLQDAESRLNEVLDIDADGVSMNQIASASIKSLNLVAMFISGTDGLVLAEAIGDESISGLKESLAAVAPQLYKKSQRSLTQAQLPAADMVTFFIGKRAVTFAGADEVFCVCIHTDEFPDAKDLAICRTVVNELVWYCSLRAVV